MKEQEPFGDQDRSVLAGEYVLGTLGPAERRRVQSAMETDEALRREVQGWSDRLLPLAGLVPPLQPPSRVWMRVQASLGLAAAVSTHGTAWAGWWNSLPLWRSLASGGAVCALALAVVLALPPTPNPQYVVVLVAPQDKAPGWVLQASDRRQIRLIPLGRMDVPPGKSLQFWTKADDWKGPVSLGLIEPGASTRVTLDQLPPLQPNQLFELTLEPANGSPIGRPTGPIQFIGRAVPVI